MSGRRQTVVSFLKSAVHTWTHRPFQGPTRPSWSGLYEIVLGTTRETFGRSGPFPQKRQWFDEVGKTAPWADVRCTETTLGGRPAEWQVPDGLPEDAPVVLYLHGGGYCIGSILSHRPLTTRLAEMGRLRLVSLDYRLAPEDPAPACLEDAVAAYRELLAQGVPAERIAIVGDSAGGGLALATLQALRDAGDPLPATGVLLSPWSDLSRNSPVNELDYITHELHDNNIPACTTVLPPEDPRVSPNLGEMAGLPPLLVLAGGVETLLPDSVELAEKARAAGVDVLLDIEPDEVHVYPFFALVNPRAMAALRRIGAWVHRHTR